MLGAGESPKAPASTNRAQRRCAHGNGQPVLCCQDQAQAASFLFGIRATFRSGRGKWKHADPRTWPEAPGERSRTADALMMKTEKLLPRRNRSSRKRSNPPKTSKDSAAGRRGRLLDYLKQSPVPHRRYIPGSGALSIAQLGVVDGAPLGGPPWGRNPVPVGRSANTATNPALVNH